MKKDEKFINIMNSLKGGLVSFNNEEKETLNISKTEKDIQGNELQEKLMDKTISSIDSNSIKSANTQNSFTSENFNEEEKDLDLPLFTSTKYTSFKFKISHLLTYFIYSWALLFSSISWILKKSDNFNTIQIIAHIFFMLSNFLNWMYYKRGCLTKANLNSSVKRNIDKSFKAKILRSETGWIHFFSFIGSIILFYGNVIYYTIKNRTIIYEVYHINFVGTMIISVTQILKIEKALTEDRQYSIKNDIQRSLVEISLFFGSLLFGSSYLIEIMYSFEEEDFIALLAILKFLGNGFVIASGIILLYRYLCAGNQDLNTSDLSVYTM